MHLDVLTLRVGGMSCAACAGNIEKALRSLDGVESGTANFGTGTVTVSFDGTRTDRDSIMRAIEKSGYSVILGGQEEADAASREESARMRNSLFVSVAFTIPLSIMAMGHMLGIPVPFHDDPAIFSIVQLILCIPVMIAGRGFFIRGLPALMRRDPNMDTLIALGTGTAFLYSIYCTALTVSGDASYVMSLAFDSAAMIIVLVTVGKYLESGSRIKTNDAVRGLFDLSPKEAVVIRNGEEIRIPAEDLTVGDTVIVKPGERIPADGRIIEGRSHIDESMLTGESIPVGRETGDTVFNGTVNGTGSFRMSAEKVGRDTALFQIIDMVRSAQGTKAPVARMADRVASVFVPVVIAVAVASCLGWYLSGHPVSFSLTVMISVLVISCPCALGLATPLAIVVGTGKAAQHGILFKSAAALEVSGGIDVVIFDKTGTITEGHPDVSDAITGMDPDEFLRFAAAAEKDSEHPLGDAVIRYAEDRGIPIPAHSGFASRTGKGVVCTVDGRTVAAGNAILMEEIGADASAFTEDVRRLSSEGKTYMFIAIDGTVEGIIAIRDPIKESSRPAIGMLNGMSVDTIMVTGDTEGTARSIASEAGVPDVRFGILPQGKSDIVRGFQTEGRTVAMTGDGINDAPALTQADLGIAVGTGTDIAIDSADVILMSKDLRSVPAALRIGRATMRNVKQNLFLAFCYNVVFIPVAAGLPYLLGMPEIPGMPMLAVAAMSLSSISVVVNALRLGRFDPDALPVPSP